MDDVSSKTCLIKQHELKKHRLVYKGNNNKNNDNDNYSNNNNNKNDNYDNNNNNSNKNLYDVSFHDKSVIFHDEMRFAIR